MSPVIIGLILAGVGLLLALGGVIIRKQGGRITSTPVVKTGEAARASGAVSVEGAVRAQQPMTAPMSGIPCVYYTLKVEEQVRKTKPTGVETKWENLFEGNYGSTFGVDDGTGVVSVLATDKLDGDLEKTFSGAPKTGDLSAIEHLMPQGYRDKGLQVLGAMQNLALKREVLAYRITERLIRADGKVFVLGTAQNGQIVRGGGPIVASTRGRDALVGSAKMRSLLAFGLGGALLAGGTVVMILKPGQAKACGVLKDMVATCAVSSEVVTAERPQADGSKKMETFRRAELAWTVTQSAKYELAAEDPKKGKALPSIQVENAIGLPMNLDLGFGFGAGAYSTKTTTRQLEPGTYKIYVFSNKDAASTLNFDIHAAH